MLFPALAALSCSPKALLLLNNAKYHFTSDPTVFFPGTIVQIMAFRTIAETEYKGEDASEFSDAGEDE